MDCDKVLPIWLKALSATAEPEEYTNRIKVLISRYYSFGRDKMLAIARRTATASQRMALNKVNSA